MQETGETVSLSGEYYRQVLARIHAVLQPQTYFEIGTETGETLALARCASIAVDPVFRLADPQRVAEIMNKPSVSFHQMTSDRFFASHVPSKLFGSPIDLAFLDGMHRCEFLLRDFLNTERSCKRNSLVILHDCLPLESWMAERVQGRGVPNHSERREWWTGDVWRAALLLKRRRPDLHMTTIDAQPTGLVLITNLDPDSEQLTQNYHSYVDEMMSWDLSAGGISRLFEEMAVEPSSALESEDQITARFWL